MKKLVSLALITTMGLACTACESTPVEMYQQVDAVLDARCAAVPESIRGLERAAFEAKTGLSWDLCIGRGRNNPDN